MFYCRQGEPQILDYQTQQYNLLPALATCYAFNFVGKYTIKVFDEVKQQVLQGNFDRLQEVNINDNNSKPCTVI